MEFEGGSVSSEKISPVTSIAEQFRVAKSLVNWKLETRNPIYQRPWMTINLDDYQKADGDPALEFVTVETADWVAVLPVDQKKQQAILICEYHRGMGDAMIKLPAGKIKPGQTPLDAAMAELREESGFEGNVRLLATKRSIPMWYTAQVHFVLAEVDADTYVGQKLESNEEIAVIRAPLKELVGMVHSNHPLVEDLDLSFAVLLAETRGYLGARV